MGCGGGGAGGGGGGGGGPGSKVPPCLPLTTNYIRSQEMFYDCQRVWYISSLANNLVIVLWYISRIPHSHYGIGNDHKSACGLSPQLCSSSVSN